jgi:hypothetical protein
MGTKEHVAAVADYLRVAGCDSVDGVFLGIGGIGAGASKAGVRAALKQLGAFGRKTGGWKAIRWDGPCGGQRQPAIASEILFKLSPWADFGPFNVTYSWDS